MSAEPNPRQLHIPPEILDHIVDFLHNDTDALKQCCTVSKSWVPRARRHIFFYVEFGSAAKLELWKQMFPDNSPACYTRWLFLCLEAVTVADGGEDGWIRGFSHVVLLYVRCWHDARGPGVPLTLFHGFSPVLNSLCIISSNSLRGSWVFGLISILPHLNNLSLYINEIRDDASDATTPPTVVQSSPPFTGLLDLSILKGSKLAARWLLELPGGLHFRRLVFSRLSEDDLESATALVVGCSNALEDLAIAYSPASHLSSRSVDLSKATKLRDVSFTLASLNVEHVTRALRTVTPVHLDFRHISIRMPYLHVLIDDGVNVVQRIQEPVRRQWLDLDSILVQFWESRLIRPNIQSLGSGESRKQMCGSVGCLLPEGTKRGIIELVVE